MKAIEHYIEAGFDHVILTQIGPKQDRFMDFFARELAPKLRQHRKRPNPKARQQRSPS